MTKYYFKIRDLEGRYNDDFAPYKEVFVQRSPIFEKSINIFGDSKLIILINSSQLTVINNFLKNSDLVFDREILIHYLLWLNHAYYNSVQFVQDPILSDLDRSPTDSQKLAKLLSDPDKAKSLQAVSFKFLKGTESFTNYFTLVDIIDALKKAFPVIDVPKSKYSSASTVQLLEYYTVNELYNYLKSENTAIEAENPFFRFIGDFFHCAQIPLSREDDLTLTDPSTVRKILKGKDSLKNFIKH